MKLLQFHEWFGPAYLCHEDRRISPREQIISYATDLDMNDALSMVGNYQKAFNAMHHASTSITLRLIGASDIGLCNHDTLQYFGVSLVEDLPQSKEDFD